MTDEPTDPMKDAVAVRRILAGLVGRNPWRAAEWAVLVFLVAPATVTRPWWLAVLAATPLLVLAGWLGDKRDHHVVTLWKQRKLQ